LFPKERADLIVRSDNETLRSDQVVETSEHSIQTARNGTRLVIAKKTVIKDEHGKPQYLLTVVDDVTERRNAERRISYLAQTDSLTDLPNRATFVDYLAGTLDEAAKNGKQFSILCIDLDRFKVANDIYGHLIGDALLREVGRRLRASAKAEFIARVGGDEFTLIVKHGPHPAAAERLAAQLIADFQNDFEVEGQRCG
jgi:diguanylate cyclase (GGDEF)-like protein